MASRQQLIQRKCPFVSFLTNSLEASQVVNACASTPGVRINRILLEFQALFFGTFGYLLTTQRPKIFVVLEDLAVNRELKI
jgi:hypothetical protein